MNIIRGINVGTTDIEAKYVDFTEKSKKTSITVTEASLFYIDTPDDCVYTGYEINPHPTVYTEVDGEKVHLYEGVDYILSYSDNINVGIATVYATGINNYKGVVSSIWKITPATLFVEKNDQNYSYDGELHGEGISASGNSENIIIEYSFDGISYTCNVLKIKDAKDSCKIYYRVSAPNFNTETGYYNITISRITASLKWGISSWLYDGNSHSVECIVDNLIDGDVCDVIISNNSISEIGEKNVEAIYLTNDNYVLPSDNSIFKLISITPGLFVKLNGTWTPVSKVFRKIGGTWVEQDMLVSFSTDGHYVCKS